MASLCVRYHWPPDFWRHMGWGEFVAHLRAAKRRDEALEVSPDSWRNAENDPWWQQVRQEREQKRLERMGG